MNPFASQNKANPIRVEMKLLSTKTVVMSVEFTPYPIIKRHGQSPVQLDIEEAGKVLFNIAKLYAELCSDDKLSARQIDEKIFAFAFPGQLLSAFLADL